MQTFTICHTLFLQSVYRLTASLTCSEARRVAVLIYTHSAALTWLCTGVLFL